MTVDEAEKRAQDAFNAMCDDPEIWLTHGCPGIGKEARIVAVIAGAIAAAVESEAVRTEIETISAKLAKMSSPDRRSATP